MNSSIYSELGTNDISIGSTDDDFQNWLYTFILGVRTIGIPMLWLKLVPGIIFAIGAIANLLVILSIIRYRRYRSPVFMIMLCLSIADVLVCLSSVLRITVMNPFLLGPWWLCPVIIFFVFCSVLSSSLHLTCISIVRFYQLVFPLQARARFTPRLLTKFSFAIWLFSVINNVPLAAFQGSDRYENDTEVIHVCSYKGPGKSVFDLWVRSVYYILPFIIATIFHILKHCMTRNRTSTQIIVEPQTTTNLHQQQQQHHQQTASVRVLMIVVLAFLLTALPAILFALIAYIFGIYNRLIEYIFDKVFFSNSALNPFIFALAAPSVRVDIVQMVMCKSMGVRR